MRDDTAQCVMDEHESFDTPNKPSPVVVPQQSSYTGEKTELPSLQQLLSDDQKNVLDTIDSLREYSLAGELPLPEIIVCGDQSSGKSSVLEAISKAPFPRDSSLCTRFATEFVLRRTPTHSTRVSIIPSEERKAEERMRLEAFTHRLESLEELPAVIKKAKVAMGIKEFDEPGLKGLEFARDVLKIELSGPDKPQLTLVDLPGLFRSRSDSQTQDDPMTVRQLVESYMRKPSTIILAIVSASNDWQTQEVLEVAKPFDPDRQRTLGVITKPDRISPNSNDERPWLRLANNETKKLKLGWHVVMNGGLDDLSEDSLDRKAELRDEREKEFFARRAFVPSEATKLDVGITSLRTRLSHMLFSKIQESLPTILDDINKRIPEYQKDLKKLGKGRETFEDHRAHLIEVSEKYMKACEKATAMFYEGDALPSNYSSLTDEPNSLRICANFLSLYDEVANNLRVKGSKFHWKDGTTLDKESLKTISWEDAIEKAHLAWIKYYRARGELPGQPNQQLLRELFIEYSEPWNQISVRALTKAHALLYAFIEHIIASITDPTTGDNLITGWFDGQLSLLDEDSMNQLDLLIKANKGYPLTRQLDYREKLLKIAIDKGNHIAKHNSNIAELERTAVGETLMQMQAYYEISLNRFTDNILQLILEPMLSELPRMFCPTVVERMPRDLINSLAAEEPSTSAQRATLSSRLARLQDGKRKLDRVLFRKTGMMPDRSSLWVPDAGMERPRSRGFSRSRTPERSFAGSDVDSPHAGQSPASSVERAEESTFARHK